MHHGQKATRDGHRATHDAEKVCSDDHRASKGHEKVINNDQKVNEPAKKGDFMTRIDDTGLTEFAAYPPFRRMATAMGSRVALQAGMSVLRMATAREIEAD